MEGEAVTSAIYDVVSCRTGLSVNSPFSLIVVNDSYSDSAYASSWHSYPNG
jgi:hypothetical protein